MRKILFNKFFYIPAIVMVGVAAWAGFFRTKAPSYELATVTRGTLIQNVSVTGTVKAVQRVDLSYEQGGRVAWVPVQVGDIVSAGQTLLSLDTTSAALDLKQAQATLAADEANLKQLQEGTRPEDLAVLQSKYQAAQSALSDAKRNLVSDITDAYTKADDAVRNYSDQFFDNPRSSSAAVNISINDYQLKLRLNTGRFAVENTLTSWQSLLLGLDTSAGLAAATQSTRENLSAVGAFLDDLALAVNALTPTQTLTLTTLTSYRSNISTARAEVNTAISSFSAGADSYATAVSNLDIADKNLKVGEAGTAPEAVEAAQAKVLGDQARVDSIRHTIGVSSIRAPFAGTVTRQEGKVGEVVAPNTALVSLIGAGFQIEANVPEADIAKIAVGQNTSVTLDAYGSGVMFDAVVTKIDPAETLIDNVATYKVTFDFLQPDSRIKSGMTANLEVQSAKKDDALMIPARAVIGHNGSSTVRLPVSAGTTTERQVVTGLKSSDGQIEIISGLQEGEEIIVSSR